MRAIYKRLQGSIELINTGISAIRKPQILKKGPTQINVEISTVCNMNCESCYRSHDQRAIASLMSFNDFKTIVKKISPLNICLVGFGEPLLNPDVFQMVRFMKNKGILSSITTNGTLIGKYAKDIVESGLNTLSVSIDAPDKYTYCNARQSDQFDLIISGLTCFYNMKSSDTSLVFHYVILKENYTGLSDFIKLCSKFKPSMIYFQPAEIYSESDRERFTSGIERDEFLDSIKRANEIAHQYKIYTNLNFWLRDFKYLWQKYSLSADKPISKRACLRPWISSYVTISGDIVPCCGLAVNPEYVTGNIFQEDFINVWNNVLYSQIRKDIKTGLKSHASCQQCVPLTIKDKYRNFRKRI